MLQWVSTILKPLFAAACSVGIALQYLVNCLNSSSAFQGIHYLSRVSTWSLNAQRLFCMLTYQRSSIKSITLRLKPVCGRNLIRISIRADICVHCCGLQQPAQSFLLRGVLPFPDNASDMCAAHNTHHSRCIFHWHIFSKATAARGTALGCVPWHGVVPGMTLIRGL